MIRKLFVGIALAALVTAAFIATPSPVTFSAVAQAVPTPTPTPIPYTYTFSFTLSYPWNDTVSGKQALSTMSYWVRQWHLGVPVTALTTSVATPTPTPSPTPTPTATPTP